MIVIVKQYKRIELKLKLILSLFTILLVNWSMAQNKKEQIETLMHQSDSLKQVLVSKDSEILNLKLENTQKSESLKAKESEIEVLKSQLNLSQLEKMKTDKSLDSLKNVILQQNGTNSPFCSKKQILSRLIGDYHLDNISGFAGMNTMFDTYRDNDGSWVSNSSNLEGGMRESYENELTQSDIKLLESLTIQVDSNLAVTFKIGSKTMFTTHFIEKGMDYNITVIEGEELNMAIKELTPATTFIEDFLVLFAKNKIELSYILQGNFDVTTEDVITLKYNLFTSFFELEIFNNECCETSTLFFKNY